MAWEKEGYKFILKRISDYNKTDATNTEIVQKHNELINLLAYISGVCQGVLGKEK